MKYCVDNETDSLAYWNYVALLTKLKFGQKLKVYFNEDAMPEVLECDDEEGYLVIPERDDQGQIVVTDSGNLQTLKLYGKVEVRIESN